jgi:hypothetical protein
MSNTETEWIVTPTGKYPKIGCCEQLWHCKQDLRSAQEWLFVFHLLSALLAWAHIWYATRGLVRCLCCTVHAAVSVKWALEELKQIYS